MDETDAQGADMGVPDSGPAPDAGAAPEAPADPTAAAGGEPAPWGGPSQQEWEQTQQALHAMASYAPVLDQLNQALYQQPQQEQYQQPQQQPQEEFDPFDPQSVDTYVNSLLEQRLQERLAPLEQQAMLHQVRTGQEIARTRLDQIAAQLGETPDQPAFDRPRAEALAHLYAGAGYTPHQALELAAKEQHQFEQKLRDQAIAAHNQQLAAVSQAPREPGRAGSVPAGELSPIPTGPGYGVKAAREAAARLGITGSPRVGV